MEKTKISIILVAVGFSFVLIILGLLLTTKPKEIEVGQGQSDNKISVKIESVEPLELQKGVTVVPQVVVNFATSLRDEKIELKTNPAVEFSVEIDTSGKKATFSPKSNLKPKTKYNLKVLVEGQSIFNWDVTTKSRGTSQKNLASVVNKIRKETPVKKTGFRISYDAATDQFFVFVEKAPVRTYRNKANSWLKGQGLKDFEALNINYVVQGSLLR